MAKPDKEVRDLERLMSVCKISAYEASKLAGMAPSNWSRWWNLGKSPTLSRFGKFRVAVIDIAIDKGALPEDCHHKPVAELIELAKGWKV